ncbi:hypothetical protein A0U91_15740 (plasmid) [Acetobacter persici]|uniref:Uncharacterized protein n=2 Tax=Acetobacter persici TaxID=1076596 RepID=A0A1U9LJ35_9PROT|nr:hypothetical protein A0U91_15740 [Acetobacter persici]
MYSACEYLIQKERFTHIRSGGAALSDHQAILLTNAGVIRHENATICLPAHLNSDLTGFVENALDRFCPGRSANRHHAALARHLGLDPFQDFRDFIAAGGTVQVNEKGFKARNLDIVRPLRLLDDGVLAFTFGSQTPWVIRQYAPHVGPEDAGLGGSGTKHAWAHARTRKWHACLD